MEFNHEYSDSLKEQIRNLPNTSGIYKYFTKENELIYVGKAKNIKKRVSSYFTKKLTDNKTRILVSQINRIEFIVVNSETDALLLENNLIKTNQPKYNILLRDDKTFPYILITNQRFPKIITTRKLNTAKGEYFGPFASVSSMYLVLNLIKKTFTIRNCDLNLTEKNIGEKKYKRCLEFHLGNCKAPCEGLQTEKDYLNDISQIREILEGDLRIVKKHFKEKIKREIDHLEFEQAFKTKTQIELLENYQSSSMISNSNLKNKLVVTFEKHESKYYANYIKIVFGRITQSKTVEIKQIINESDIEIFQSTLIQIILELKIINTTIFTNTKLELQLPNIKIIIPKQGSLKALIDLSLKNILFYRNKNKELEPTNSREDRVLEKLRIALNLKESPTHIECFDNSNLQGTTPVAAMVCFINGKASKKDYRHYNIKTVVGPNDFASMEEIITRRYKRLLEENKTLPNLIIIDGGKGQLSSALNALEKLNLSGQIPIISIAKKLEEIYTPKDEIPLLLGKKSEELLLLTKIRDEVHRFGISFHRAKRDKTPLNKKGK